MSLQTETVQRVIQSERRLLALERREPKNSALGNVIVSYLSLPGLRGFWPMSSFDDSGNAIDLSGQGRDLTYNGNPTYNVDGLAPYIDFDGTGDYLSRADEAGLQIIGDESYVASGLKGLTIGGWFYADVSGGILMGDHSATGTQRAFILTDNSSGGTVQFDLLGEPGGGDLGADFTGAATGAWQFRVGRWTPAVGADGWVNATKTTLADTTPATLKDTTSPFGIGAYDDGTTAFDGRASMCFICAAAVPDATITELYQISRGLFGV